MSTFIQWFLADIITRILYFIGTFIGIILAVVFLSSRSLAFVHLFTPTGLTILCALSLLSALIGPYLYTKKVNRGRGTLREVKKNSKNWTVIED